MRWISRPGPRIAAALALISGFAMAALAGQAETAPELPAGQITVTGQFGSIPVVDFVPPLPRGDLEVRELVAGTGLVVPEGGPVVLSLATFDGGDGVRLDGAGIPLVLYATATDLGEVLHDAVVGRTEGSRLLILEPAEQVGGNMMATVVDILHTRAVGEPVGSGDEERVTVTDVDGVPQISHAEGMGPPDTLQIRQLIRGEGPQVVPGQRLVVQFVAYTWVDAAQWDSTWDAGVPAVMDLDTAFPGVRTGLLDQPVGSRVLLEIPPAEGLGTDSLLMVVDILAAY